MNNIIKKALLAVFLAISLSFILALIVTLVWNNVIVSALDVEELVFIEVWILYLFISMIPVSLLVVR